MARRARRPEARGAARGAARRRSGSRPSACRSSARSGPAASLDPAIAAPAAYAERGSGRARRRWSRSLRGRLEGQGPVTQDALAAPLGLEPDEHRGRAGGARGRGLRHARPLHAGRRCGRMVRAPAARPHPPLHDQASARGDRAGRGARLPALPAALAARRRPTRAWRARTRSTPSSGSSKASRRRPAPGRPRSCRRVSPATSRPGSTTAAWPDGSPGARLEPRNGRANGSERRAAPVRTTPITLLARSHAPLWASLSTKAGRGPSRAPRAQAVVDFIRRAWRIVLRRAGRRHRAVALPGRGGAGRAGGARPRDLRQLRRAARAAGAVRTAQADGGRRAAGVAP